MDVMIYSLSELQGSLLIIWCKKNKVVFGYDYDSLFGVYNMHLPNVDGITIKKTETVLRYVITCNKNSIDLLKEEFENIEIN